MNAQRLTTLACIATGGTLLAIAASATVTALTTSYTAALERTDGTSETRGTFATLGECMAALAGTETDAQIAVSYCTHN